MCPPCRRLKGAIIGLLINRLHFKTVPVCLAGKCGWGFYRGLSGDSLNAGRVCSADAPAGPRSPAWSLAKAQRFRVVLEPSPSHALPGFLTVFTLHVPACLGFPELWDLLAVSHLCPPCVICFFPRLMLPAVCAEQRTGMSAALALCFEFDLALQLRHAFRPQS